MINISIFIFIAILFLILFIGVFLGVSIMCLMFISRENTEIEEYNNFKKYYDRRK